MTAPRELTRDGIAALIPHSGTMCVLSRLQSWDESRIVCSASSHRDADNPMRTASGLMSPVAIEYAAQAMALHGALIASLGSSGASNEAAAPGYLASVRGIELSRLRIDDLPGDLLVEAHRQAGDDRQILYRFTVSHAGEAIATGRAAVVLNTPLALP